PGAPKPAPLVEMPPTITNSLGIRLSLIPAGEFLMGSADGDLAASADEKPQHHVRITRPFFLGVYEVTQGQYSAAMGVSPSTFKGSDDLPVDSIGWYEAVNFCNALSTTEEQTPFYRIDGQTVDVPDWSGTGYRLPTEAEWEYASRAGTNSRYSFGDNPS